MSASANDSSDAYLEEDTFYDPSGGDHDASTQHMTPEEKARKHEEWMAELVKTEEEITTLRQVLASKLRRSHELKAKLGITVWGEMREDLKKGVATIREMPSYQKTTQVVRTAKEKTSTKWSAFRNSNVMKSFEDRVGSAYTNVKGRISGSRSQQNMQDPSGDGAEASDSADKDGVPEESKAGDGLGSSNVAT